MMSLKGLNVRNIRSVTCLIFVSIAILSCSKKDKDIKFEAIPTQPIVIDSPLTRIDPITGAKKVFQPPWYSFSVKITNNSSSKITFVGMKATVNSMSDSDFNTTEFKFDPGSDNGTSWYYAVINAGATYEQSGWIIGGLPKSDSFSYGVSLEMMGWYGDYNAPEKRLSHTFYHSTQ